MRKPKDRSFDQIVKGLKFNGHETNYCTTASTCAVSGLSAGKVVALAKRHVDDFELNKGLDIDRFRSLLESVYGDNFRIEGGEFGETSYAGRQFRTVAKELAEKGGRWIIVTMSAKSGHATAIRDGKIIDWMDETKRNRVGYVIEVPATVVSQ
jgi:hypothetical protein